MHERDDKVDDETWYRWADETACDVCAALPDALRERLKALAITLDPWPTSEEELQEGDDEALLGLFVGPCFGEELDAEDPTPPAIRLFVENLRDEAGGDPTRFRDEVRTTLLHELGHYLGLDEQELDARGLA